MSEGKSKGVISLRKKKTGTRPKISAPTLISAPSNDSIPTFKAPNWDPSQNGSSTSLAIPAPRPRPSISGSTDRTADLVKRRYSTRFAQPQDNGEGPPSIPGLPQLPAQYRQPTSRPPSSKSSRAGRSPERRTALPIKVDLKAFRDAHLQPEQCIFPQDFHTTDAPFTVHVHDIDLL